MKPRIKVDALPSNAEQTPIIYALPDEPPILVNEPKVRRNRSYDRKLSRKPIAERITEAELFTTLYLGDYRRSVGDKRRTQEADAKLA